jgi:hypothetical protein
MGRLVIVAGGGIEPWKTATICLCIFLGPCALALLWFGLRVLLGYQKTLYQAICHAKRQNIKRPSEAFKADWQRMRND